MENRGYSGAATMKPQADADISKKALDELFSLTSQYRRASAFSDLIKFVSTFRSYSPYNAMLIHVQQPGSTFVAPPHRWLQDYNRTIKDGARPLVILQPMGPVMFVFDVSDTEGDPVPDDVLRPFAVSGKKIGDKLPKTLDNCVRDGIETHHARMGSQRGGSIRPYNTHKVQRFRDMPIKVNYSLELKQEATDEENFATLAHELGHLYCGHVGTHNPRWWPSRMKMTHDICEIEAESVAYLVCSRFGLKNASEKYLAGYVNPDAFMPPISLECIMKSAGLIEKMGKMSLPLRKPDKA